MKPIFILVFFIFQLGIPMGETLGIPMGENTSPFTADLFLAWREYESFNESITHNFEFGSLVKNIYPKQLL
jgi:hypothetical protein